MKKCIFLFLVLIGCGLFAQSKTVQSTSITSNDEWEYLVISFGKTYFGVAEKSILYQQIENGLGNEATDLQKNLDSLGKLGWELVTVVGTIGGDQEIVLKRKTNPNRIKMDEQIIKQIMETDEKEWKEKKDKELQEKKKNEDLVKQKKALINIDEQEQNAAIEMKEQEFSDYMKYIMESIDDSHIIKKEGKNNSYSYDITVQLDLTKDFLIEENKYRKSDVDRYVDEIIGKISIDKDKQWTYMINVKVDSFISLNNQKINVGSKTKTWKYYDE